MICSSFSRREKMRLPGFLVAVMKIVVTELAHQSEVQLFIVRVALLVVGIFARKIEFNAAFV